MVIEERGRRGGYLLRLVSADYESTVDEKAKNKKAGPRIAAQEG